MTSLYRHYNEKGILLYVGIADDHHVRFQSHLHFSVWKDKIASVKIEKFPTREQASAAEVAAIKTEHPLYNSHHQEKGSIGDVLKKVLKAIDYQEIEDTIDDYNETECESYRVYCLTFLKDICGSLKIDFEASILPQLEKPVLAECCKNCECKEARSDIDA